MEAKDVRGQVVGHYDGAARINNARLQLPSRGVALSRDGALVLRPSANRLSNFSPQKCLRIDTASRFLFFCSNLFSEDPMAIVTCAGLLQLFPSLPRIIIACFRNDASPRLKRGRTLNSTATVLRPLKFDHFTMHVAVKTEHDPIDQAKFHVDGNGVRDVVTRDRQTEHQPVSSPLSAVGVSRARSPSSLTAVHKSTADMGIPQRRLSTSLLHLGQSGSKIKSPARGDLSPNRKCPCSPPPWAHIILAWMLLTLDPMRGRSIVQSDLSRRCLSNRPTLSKSSGRNGELRKVKTAIDVIIATDMLEEKRNHNMMSVGVSQATNDMLGLENAAQVIEHFPERLEFVIISLECLFQACKKRKHLTAKIFDKKDEKKHALVNPLSFSSAHNASLPTKNLTLLLYTLVVSLVASEHTGVRGAVSLACTLPFDWTPAPGVLTDAKSQVSDDVSIPITAPRQPSSIRACINMDVQDALSTAAIGFWRLTGLTMWLPSMHPRCETPVQMPLHLPGAARPVRLCHSHDRHSVIAGRSMQSPPPELRRGYCWLAGPATDYGYNKLPSSAEQAERNSKALVGRGREEKIAEAAREAWLAPPMMIPPRRLTCQGQDKMRLGGSHHPSETMSAAKNPDEAAVPIFCLLSPLTLVLVVNQPRTAWVTGYMYGRLAAK
ncbi:hypothetical protein HRG_014089 [Hirsutella rhossiliensis]